MGKVASGTFSPTLETGIATAYVPAALAAAGHAARGRDPQEDRPGSRREAAVRDVNFAVGVRGADASGLSKGAREHMAHPSDRVYSKEHEWVRRRRRRRHHRHLALRAGPARRGRLRRPAQRGRRADRRRDVRRDRVGQVGLRALRAGDRRDRRGQRRARRRARDRELGPARRGLDDQGQAGRRRPSSTASCPPRSTTPSSPRASPRCATYRSRANSAKRCFALSAFRTVDELFADVPEAARLDRPLDLPDGHVARSSCDAHLRALAGANDARVARS